VRIDVVVAGSLALFHDAALLSSLEIVAGSDVVLLPTAAAFRGMAEAALVAAQELEASGAHVEALMIADREAANETHFATRIGAANWVVLLDGSALHARATWRDTAVGETLRHARLIAIGECATVIGDEMIDPRGGAPTSGLGYVGDVVFAQQSSSEQLTRTRQLLAQRSPLIVLDSRGVVVRNGERWQQWSDDDVTVTRGSEPLSLEQFSSQ
jgi:cyanophycinase-like exopeptidase